MVYDRITPSDESGEIGFRKVKNFSAMHRQERKNMPVNEVSGYRKFGGCLDVYYGCASRAKYDGDIKTKREDHKIK